ncbi:er to golgi transport-related protein [Pyrrhoderma noxium]|uniref:Er to golgi transport-related protein n=1 Tax=Pyrrhoderma noxium TaxID=2282107 RepID=A0A286UVS5_9AGAM|nr:er to golgi transport-related protein [Pyrrhoderma noxium]
MHSQRAKVTLSGPPQLTTTDDWPQIWSGLSAQFPLRNLHWKPASRTSIRTIQSLDINLLALESVKDESASQIPTSLLDRPLINVYVLICEDIETYKASLRKHLKDWHSLVTQRKGQEWMVISVSKTDNRQTQTGLLKMRGTVLDRIRADFNSDKKDRCIQLSWASDLKSPPIWAEIISKMKDGIIVAFDQAVSQREDEIKRSELQRTMPGWNFCTFFILKESLASSFEGANLLEDSLLQYEELEASFFQVLKDRTLWFGKFVDPAPKDDSLPLLSISKKPYRDMILANTISVFDIRVYLLAKQLGVLGKMGRLSDAARKASLFLLTFGNRLRDFKTELPDCFVESWIYSSALSAVDTLDDWARNKELDTITSNQFNSAKGELLFASRNQLDRLGIRLNFLPFEPPFSNCAADLSPEMDSNQESSVINHDSQSISNTDILGFLGNKASFYDLYIRLTNRAIDLFAKSGRRKTALKLHGSLAALDSYRERHGNALQTYTSLPAHYAPHHWASLESYMLFQSIETHTRMGKDRDRQWIHTALNFVKAYVEKVALDLLYEIKDMELYVEQLVESAIKVSNSVDGDLLFQDHPVFTISPIVESGRSAETRDGYLLDVNVHNNLPCKLDLDKISVVLTRTKASEAEFISDKITLEPGTTMLTLFCPLPKPGTFLVGKSEARMGRLVFHTSFNEKIKKRQDSLGLGQKLPHKIVKLPLDPRSVILDLQQALQVDIGGQAKFSLKLTSGRNHISTANIKLSSPDVIINLEKCIKNNESVTFFPDVIQINNMTPGEVIHFDVPHSSSEKRENIKISTDIEYETIAEPNLIRRMSFEKLIPTSVNITVNIQDFFRGESLLSKFTISTISYQHIRISAVDLVASDADEPNLKILKPEGFSNIVTVTPSQPADFVFQLGLAGEVNDPLRLCITYRLLREEVETLVTSRIHQTIPESDWKQRELVESQIVQALEIDSSWVEMYEMTGELFVPTKSVERSNIIPDELYLQIFDKLQEASSPEDTRFWRKFTIPLDLPRLDILATTHIDIRTNPFDKESANSKPYNTIYAGQPVSATLSINTSMYWAGQDKKNAKEYKMRFLLEENIKDWLVSGQKRGDFVAKDGSTYTVHATFMALRNGEFPLPNVRLSAYPLDNGDGIPTPPSLETYQEHAAKRVLVLPRGGRTTFFVNVGRD